MAGDWSRGDASPVVMLKPFAPLRMTLELSFLSRIDFWRQNAVDFKSLRQLGLLHWKACRRRFCRDRNGAEQGFLHRILLVPSP